MALGGGVSGLAGGIGRLEEAELQSLLKLLAQFGEAQLAKNPQLDASSWQLKIAALPQNAKITLQQALATVAAQSPTAKLDEAMLSASRGRPRNSVRHRSLPAWRSEGQCGASDARPHGPRTRYAPQTAEIARRKIGQRGNVGGIARRYPRPAILGGRAGVGQEVRAHVHRKRGAFPRATCSNTLKS